MDQHALESIDELRELIPPPSAPSVHKEVDHLDEHCREFIALSPFLVLSSADSGGAPDASPKGGPPGFVHVLDERRLAMPDYPGNRRLDSYANVLDGGNVQLLFLIPGLGETLRVSGRARLSRDPALLERLADTGKPPKVALEVAVETAYLHCAKALKRSALWDPATWPDPQRLPSAARIYKDHIALEGITEEAAAEHLGRDYEHNLWPS